MPQPLMLWARIATYLYELEIRNEHNDPAVVQTLKFALHIILKCSWEHELKVDLAGESFLQSFCLYYVATVEDSKYNCGKFSRSIG